MWYGDGYASTTVSGADLTMRPRSSSRRVEIVRRVDAESMKKRAGRSIAEVGSGARDSGFPRARLERRRSRRVARAPGRAAGRNAARRPAEPLGKESDARAKAGGLAAHGTAGRRSGEPVL